MLLATTECAWPGFHDRVIVMQRNKLSTEGVQIKALDGVYANLRWDIGVASYGFYWDMLNHKSDATENYQHLSDFARGIGGGSGISRADYIYDNVALPEVIFMLLMLLLLMLLLMLLLVFT